MATRSLPGRGPGDVLRLRSIVVGAAMVSVFALVAARLAFVQLLSGDEFSRRSQANFVQPRVLEHARGQILDRRGRVLATGREAASVLITPAFLPSVRRGLRDLFRGLDFDTEARAEIAGGLSRAVAEEGLVALGRGFTEAHIERLLANARAQELPVRSLVVWPRAGHGYEAFLDATVYPTKTVVLRRLGRILGMSTAEVRRWNQRLSAIGGGDRYAPILVRRELAPEFEERLRLEIDAGLLPGVSVRVSRSRYYPLGEAAAHLVGYVNEMSAEEWRTLKSRDYRLGQVLGRRGIEKMLEAELRGRDGIEYAVVDSKGRHVQSELAAALGVRSEARQPPVNGHQVHLALDAELQTAADRALRARARAGAVAVVEVKTGMIRALVSLPGFDPNAVSGYFDPDEKARLHEIRGLRPWRFRAVQDQFAPGSTFKVVTALAAATTPEGVLPRAHCGGAYYLGRRRFRCWKDSGHGPVDLKLALARSCDVYFYHSAAKMGLDPIAAVGRQLGLGRTLGLGLEEEAEAIMPDEAWYQRNKPEGYTRGAAVNVSIGQGALAVTPLQLAVAYAGIANGGRVMKPILVERVVADDGRVIRRAQESVTHQLRVPEKALRDVLEGLRWVTGRPFGTSYYRRSRVLNVAGKTGTAQVAKLGADRKKSRSLPWKLRDHAWFAALAPAESPQVAIVVFNEHGGSGSRDAAPIAMEVAEAWWKLAGSAPPEGDS